jgi:hypothetical protein
MTSNITFSLFTYFTVWLDYGITELVGSKGGQVLKHKVRERDERKGKEVGATSIPFSTPLLLVILLY